MPNYDVNPELFDRLAKLREYLPPQTKQTLTESYTKMMDNMKPSPLEDKAKTNDNHPDFSQVPMHSIMAIGAIFEEGEVKYGRDNWKKAIGDKGYQRKRWRNAAIHLWKWANGDTTEAHLAKVAWFCVTQLELERLEREKEEEEHADHIYSKRDSAAK